MENGKEEMIKTSFICPVRYYTALRMKLMARRETFKEWINQQILKELMADYPNEEEGR